jgi:hypothetical protein
MHGKLATKINNLDIIQGIITWGWGSFRSEPPIVSSLDLLFEYAQQLAPPSIM